MSGKAKSIFDETIRGLLDKAAPWDGPNGAMTVSKLGAAGAETLAALIIVVGDDQVVEVVKQVRQLPIWNQSGDPRSWVDECDRVVFVAAVRALGTYGVFARGIEEGDVELLSRRIPMGKTRAEVQDALDSYAKKKGWIGVPSAACLHDLLSEVMKPAPQEGDMAAWSDLERAQAAMWAMATQLEGSENRVSIPLVPNCLVTYFRRTL
jgi:hypothetical protein